MWLEWRRWYIFVVDLILVLAVATGGGHALLLLLLRAPYRLLFYRLQLPLVQRVQRCIVGKVVFFVHDAAADIPSQVVGRCDVGGG